MKDITNSFLYHYTSFQTLEKILKNKEIWLGNLRYMNDYKEMKYFFEGLKNSITEDFPEYVQKTEQLFDMQLKRFEGKTAYAFCLSKRRDDAAQWDRYAKRGQGVCICFDACALKNAIKDKAIIYPVFYAESMDKHEIKAIIELYILESIVVNGFNSIDEVFENAWASSVAYKHPSFSAEDEVRICSYPFAADKYSPEELRYVSYDGGLREYYPIKLNSDHENDYAGTIKEIILGPCSGVDKNMFGRYIVSLGIKNGLFDVTESRCPLR